jgi:DNA-binding transcriptional regulator YdaS (Cro superfamily)
MAGMETLTSVNEVSDALGGDEATGAIAGVAPKTVKQWKFRKRLPQDKYLVISQALSERGKKADVALWRFVTEQAS